VEKLHFKSFKNCVILLISPESLVAPNNIKKYIRKGEATDISNNFEKGRKERKVQSK
jgi:hypothetical protein